jgi:NDP-sugar pyrophosphorylase family protein
MVFAAGLGTRLRPLTERLPKALVDVGGEPALGHVLRRLAAVGAGRIVVNAHPFADAVGGYLREISPKLRTDATGPGPLLLLSREPERPLETGGGLLRAASLFNGDRPILLHNVDVVTGLDLGALLAAHRGSGALATLAVQDRPSSRRLLFDEEGLLGREDEPLREVRGVVAARAFAGVHVAAPELPGLLGKVAGGLGGPAAGPDAAPAESLDESAREEGGSDPVFSIVDAYLELAARGASIWPHDVTGAPWFEIGTPERLAEAKSAVEEGRV